MITSSLPLVSVVTPVFNEAVHLAECIESILAQTYQNWDYTIVDNCSTDGTLEVALRYARRDSRIRVHRNDRHLAVIPNHNAALRRISPDCKYCKVVFGDDWLFPGCLEQMVDLAEAHASVGIVGAYALEGQRVAWAGLEYPSSKVNGREICRRHILDGVHVFGSANSVLYRASLVRARDRFYNEANIHADTEVCFDLLRVCDFGFVHQVLTYTRVRPASLSAMTRELDTWFPTMLHLLVTHAPNYLTREEQSALFMRHVISYYRFLGKNLMLGRDKQFWSYHKSELIKSGIPFSRIRVIKGALETMVMAVSNPGYAMQRMLDRRRTRRSAGRTAIRAGRQDDVVAGESKEASSAV